MGADVSICGGNHGGGSAGSSNKTHTALCEVRDATRDRVSLPPWANESRPTIYESSCYSGFCNSNALDLLSGSAIAMSNNPSCTAYAIAPPPSAEEFLNASAALRCGAFAAALEAAAAAAGNYARALPGFPGASSSPCQVPTGMTPERLSSYFYSPKAEDAMWYLDRVRELVSARGSAFREAAAAQRGEPAAGPLSEAAARLVRRPTKC
ncbi:MAG: hypothetical protein J3K34DRAFT_442502 [Monoraphidium minutum]|nr:MAG: hypothetical protein J3K34DRAFT_442502 [Monoraphidium minutum]